MKMLIIVEDSQELIKETRKEIALAREIKEGRIHTLAEVKKELRL